MVLKPFPFAAILRVSLGLFGLNSCEYGANIIGVGGKAQPVAPNEVLVSKSISIDFGTAKFATDSVDIMIVVDTSGSMNDETTLVANNLQAFFNQLSTFANTRIALVMDERSAVINNVPADTEKQILVPVPIGSINGPQLLVDLLDPAKPARVERYVTQGLKLRSFLRKNTQPVILYVTDDNGYERNCVDPLGVATNKCRFPYNDINDERFARLSQEALTNLLGKTPIVNAIIGHRNVPVSGIENCVGTAATGNYYMEAAKISKGGVWSICLQDWSEMFAQISKAIQLTVTNGFEIPIDLVEIEGVVIEFDGEISKLTKNQYELKNNYLYLATDLIKNISPGSKLILDYRSIAR